MNSPHLKAAYVQSAIQRTKWLYGHYLEWIDSPFSFKRKEAIAARCKAVVIHDRMINRL